MKRAPYALYVEALCRELHVPYPLYEIRFHATRKWRFDLAWVEAKIAVELDGGIWSRGRHVRGAGFIRDREKGNAAVMMGWRVLYFQPTANKLMDAIKSVRILLDAN